MLKNWKLSIKFATETFLTTKANIDYETICIQDVPQTRM